MEGTLHFIERDLENHEWYVELVADFIDVVEKFAAAVAVAEEEAF